MSWPPQSVNSLKLERLGCEFSETHLLLVFTKLRYTQDSTEQRTELGRWMLQDNMEREAGSASIRGLRYFSRFYNNIL